MPKGGAIRLLLAAAACGSLAMIICYVAVVPDPFYREPAPVRAFLRNQEWFEAYVGGDHSERVRAALAGCEVRYVRREGDCIVFTFPFICVDAVPMLIYSPRGTHGLPEGFWTGGGSLSRYFEPRQLNEHWFYCQWDQV